MGKEKGRRESNKKDARRRREGDKGAEVGEFLFYFHQVISPRERQIKYVGYRVFVTCRAHHMSTTEGKMK